MQTDRAMIGSVRFISRLYGAVLLLHHPSLEFTNGWLRMKLAFPPGEFVSPVSPNGRNHLMGGKPHPTHLEVPSILRVVILPIDMSHE